MPRLPSNHKRIDHQQPSTSHYPRLLRYNERVSNEQVEKRPVEKRPVEKRQGRWVMRIGLSRRQAIMSGSWLATTSLTQTLTPLAKADVTLPANAVQFRPEIEPLVRLIEETPRGKIFNEVGRLIQRGHSYRELLAALFLAAIRNVQPRPSVGFKFHSVLVINSAHLASLAARDQDRWLPIFWSIDYFKRAQQQDVSEGDWTMAAVDESRLPTPTQAVKALREAMERWDVESADAAAAAAARVAPADQLFKVFAEFGSRDFRSIGHKAIYVAGAFRVLEVIGWQHAEPVMRGLAYALLNHTGDPNPAQSDLAVDAAGRANRSLVGSFPPDWLAGKYDAAATTELVIANRQGSPIELAQASADMIANGISAASVYDAHFATAAELVMRQPQIVPLHAMTTTNAMHYLFHRCGDDTLRRWLLLQNASFLGHFREAADSRGKLADRWITDLQGEEDENVELENAVAAIGTGGMQQAQRVLGYLQSTDDPSQFLRESRQLIFAKGNDSHDYKYSSALLEDYYPRSPQWRNKILAAGSYLLSGPQAKDTDLPKRVSEALA